jgi:alpha-mannosidase
LLSHAVTSGGYGAPIDWHDQGGAIQDNPSRHDYNVDTVVDKFINSAIQLRSITKLNHQMWPCGDDFEYQNADMWFHNLDKIIHYVNYNASKGGPVVAFYSTPSHYTDSKHKASLAASTTWEVRSDDIFPLGDDAHAYWSGYFTSRPSLKRQVRVATNFLNAARQMEVIAGVTAAEVSTPTTRPSPPVGESWTDSMEGAIGVATHHDGMSGTERQDVADDYSQRISEGHFEVEAGVELALQKMTGISGEIGHCNCNSAGNCLNMSMCAFTTGVDEFTVIAWNPLGQNTSSWLRLPVSGGDGYTVTDLSTKATVPSQALAIDDRTKQLPLLYLNKYRMNATAVAQAQAALANQATHILTFEVALPPVGFSSFSVAKAKAVSETAALSTPVATTTAPIVVTNGVYSITVDPASGYVSSVENLASGAATALNISWGFYVSNQGDRVSGQASGAYMFRPAGESTHSCSTSKPTVEVFTGPLVSEIKQTFADWATHTIRLTKGSPFIEVEWTAGPIPTIAPPQPPPPPVMNRNLSGGWDVENGDVPAKLVEKSDGSFTVSDPKGEGWKSATGQISGRNVSVAIDNGVNNTGTISHDNANIKWTDGTMWSRQGAGNVPGHLGGGKEVVLQINSALASRGTFYTDSNGREMVKRQRNARGPSYPKLVVREPVAANYCACKPELASPHY